MLIDEITCEDVFRTFPGMQGCKSFQSFVIQRRITLIVLFIDQYYIYGYNFI